MTRLWKILGVLMAASLCAQAQQSDSEDTERLQKAVQNPVANLISVPFQNNINFPIGSFSRTQNVLNIQPVIPIGISENWNLITRTILPVISQPDIAREEGTENGLGDLNPTLFFSPSKPGALIWGVGPSLSLPTATHTALGTGKWSGGPSVVALVQPGKWTIGALANNLWSFAGESDRGVVNAFLLQYFVNRNFKKGWYLTSSPIITANWRVDSDERWLVPFGGGFGRVFKTAGQRLNAQASVYYNAIHPDSLPFPKWQLRLQLALLYPKNK
jgi:hypothetical protein